MLSRSFFAFAALSTTCSLVDAAPKVITGPSPGIKVIASDKIHHVQGTTFPNSAATTLSDINTSAAPFLPSDVNIVVNTTVTQREFSWVGMLYFLPRIPEGATILDGSAKTITLFQTPPNGAEEFFLRYGGSSWTQIVLYRPLY
jgi:hypothetical protein